MRCLALALILVSLTTSGCFSRFKKSASERRLASIATEIRALPSNPTSDKRVEQLDQEAWRIWKRSKGSSGDTITRLAGTDYEREIVDLALRDYYQASGRIGNALPILEASVEKAWEARCYSEWSLLTLTLVDIYDRLGMQDRAEARLEDLIQSFERIQYSLERLDSWPEADLPYCIEIHSRLLEYQPGEYDLKTTRALYQAYADSARQHPEHWGWEDGTGFRYILPAERFARHFLQLDAMTDRDRALQDLSWLHEKNNTDDPFALVEELELLRAGTRLGRDVYRLQGGGAFGSEVRELTDSQRSYLARSAFLEELARARSLSPDTETTAVLVAIENAEEESRRLEQYYEGQASWMKARDGYLLDRMTLVLLRARAHEGAGRADLALPLYEEFVEWSEEARDSLPVEQRLAFFRGSARPAYLGALRCTLHNHMDSPSEASLDRVLEKSEQFRARQFHDLLGANHDDTRAGVGRIQEQLDPGEGLLMFLDLETSTMTLVVTDHSWELNWEAKPSGWSERVFALRNELVSQRSIDLRQIHDLSSPLLAFAAPLLDECDRLFVLSDGALTALPPGLLSYRTGQHLHDQAVLTLVPSLSTWLTTERGIDVENHPDTRVLALGDPAFDRNAVVESMGNSMMRTRGSAALSYFDPLPETAEEAQIAAESFGHDQHVLLLGLDATESNVKGRSDLSTFTHLHFATHGVIGNDIPTIDQPALVLAWEESDEDGFLTAREVGQLDLAADLTVLSACNTGNGEYFDGEGLIGMGRAFLLAGSSQVIVSLWPVETFSTKFMMEALYDGLRAGLPPERALHEAQRRLRTRKSKVTGSSRGLEVSPHLAGERNIYSSPYYWSPFVLISAR